MVLPLLVGVLAGVCFPYCFIWYMWYGLTYCWMRVGPRARNRRRINGLTQSVNTWLIRLGVIMVGVPTVLIVTQVGYALCLYTCFGVSVTLMALLSALLLVFVSPLLMLFIPYYLLRLTVLTMRGLR